MTKKRAYGIWLVVAKDTNELAIRNTQIREISMIQRPSLTHKLHITVWQRYIVRGQKTPLCPEIVVDTLTDRTVSAICSYEDVATDCSVVGKVKHNAVVSLSDGCDLFVHVEALFGDLAVEDVVEHWACDNVASGSEPY